jgi:rubrerythrin
MNLKQALSVALEYEVKVRDHYAKGAKVIEDEKGKRLFETLAKEEQGHVDYLEHVADQLKKTGKIPNVELKSVLPKGTRWIEEAKRKVTKAPGKKVAKGSEVELVKVAMQYEKDAGAFYKELVSKVKPEEQGVFSQFLKIEDGHLELVAAQLDAVLGWGFWFDTREFDLEAG